MEHFKWKKQNENVETKTKGCHIQVQALDENTKACFQKLFHKEHKALSTFSTAKFLIERLQENVPT